MGEDLRRTIEEAFQLPLDQLRGNLLPLLNGIKEFGVSKLMELVPDLVPRLAKRLKEVNIAQFIKEDPEASARFMDILWEGIGLLAEKNSEVKEALQRAGNVAVNLEAIDSPMRGHFQIKDGKLSGGSGLLEKPDLTVKGYTQAMVEVFLGERDPTEAFFKQLIRTDGSIPLAMRVSSAMMEVSQLLKG